MSIWVWCGLILCNVIWAINPTVAKVLIHEVGPAHTAWFRYFGAFTAYLVGMILLRLTRVVKSHDSSDIFLKPRSRSDLISVAIIGLTTCCITPLTQMFGLRSSTAVSNSILVSLEPIYTLLFSWLILKESLSRNQLLSFCGAFAGFLFLSKLIAPETYTSSDLTASMGDVILAVAIAGEAMYSVFAKKLSANYRGPSIFGTSLFIGATLLTIITFSVNGVPAFEQLNYRAWLSIIWLGPLGTTCTYLFWLYALQKGAPVATIVVTLFVQPLIGVLSGMLFLGESIGLLQLFGGVLILASVGMQSLALEKERETSIMSDSYPIESIVRL